VNCNLWLQKPVSLVIATHWLMCDCKKNYVCFATTDCVWLQKPDSFLMQNMLICGFAKKHVCFVCLPLGEKVMYDCSMLIVCFCNLWLKTPQLNFVLVSDCTNVWLQKRKRKPNQCVIATIWRAWLQPGVMCGCKKKTWLCLCGWKATWLFGIWLQAWVMCDYKN
jgi:hypothetical protein